MGAADIDNTSDVEGIAGARLKAFIQRVETLEAEKAEISELIKEVYGEIKSVGLDTKTIRQIIAKRKLDTALRREQEDLYDIYTSAIGME